MWGLQNAQNAGNRGQTTGWGTLDGLDGFCNAWASAAQGNSNDAGKFKHAQLSAAKEGYYNKAVQWASQLGLASPLAVGQLYDTLVQLGDVVQELANNAGGWGGNDEKRFISDFMKAREQKLYNLGGAYAGTIYRLKA